MQSAYPVAIASIVLVFIGACNDPDPEHYQVRRNETPVGITAADLGVADAQLSRIGVNVLSGSPDGKRYPAAICITRVVAREANDGRSRYLRTAEFSPHHAVYWNQLLDEQPAVREVLFLTEGGLDPRGYDYHRIIEAAAQRNADLCVIYARKESIEADAEYVGVLWDTRKKIPLLTVRVAVVLPEELAVRLAKQNEDEQRDLTVNEADFRAEQEFRHKFRDAIWDMVQRDSGASGGQENPWKGYVHPRDRSLRTLEGIFGPSGYQRKPE